MAFFVLPVPPSSNERDKRRRARLRAEFKDATRGARHEVNGEEFQIQGTFKGRYRKPDGSLRRVDHQNCLKQLLDGVAFMCGFDDSRFTVVGPFTKVHSDTEECVEVEVTRLL